ncbi:glycosyltransferase family 39 protein [Rhodoferax sp. 4810]|uniref:Glycosyltransferase family 39 protein n=1 Tax=Thiospirillum jenense TaxID=1653858 RepID=A0A839HLZ0_9GAMM|nr:glycosyltransferase family 39 protein [Thiospirillum jenense]MBB1078031.1 glycosyltransferase family 39 protein [Rhodoferax jenense]MBB1127397.1 glycosyltransferase family 39 protein [Thiospirillum jenense]
MKKIVIDSILIVVVLTVGALVTWNGLVANGLWWTDESRHTMHGVFFLDFLRDLPFDDPYNYVQRYFAQYPAIAFNWYLPLFPIIVSFFMSIIGVSEFAAHIAIVFVWLVGVIAWYIWLKSRFDHVTALATVLILLSLPVVVLWSRSVMLEAPAIGMCMASVFMFQRYLDRPQYSTAIAFGLIILITLLIKQTTLFILPVLISHALVSQNRRVLFSKKESFLIVAFITLGLLIIAVHALKFGPEIVMSASSHAYDAYPSLDSLPRWIMYSTSIYKGSSIAIVILGIMGVFLLLRQQTREFTLPIAWLIASYLWCTYLASIPDDNERYAFYVMPAVAFFAAYGIHYFRHSMVYRRIMLTVTFAVIGWQVFAAINLPHWYVAGYEAAAQFIRTLPNTGSILFFGKNDGNFIFHLHRLDRDKQYVILRGDKLLVEISITKDFGIKSHVSNTSQVETLLNENWIHWIVVESKNLVKVQEVDLLNEVLRNQKSYRLVKTVPVESNLKVFKNVDILIYENLNFHLPEDGRINIKYPYLGKTYQFVF